MPIYRMLCKQCDYEQDWWTHKVLTSAEVDKLSRAEAVKQELPSCPVHQSRMVKAAVQQFKVDPWVEQGRVGLTLEHIDDTPRTFHSKKELKDFCKKKGYSSGALL